MYKLSQSLDQVSPFWDASLMCSDSLDRIREVAAHWPVAAVDFFGFECQLAGETLTTDCALNLTPHGARMLAERPPEGNECWRKVSAFYREWARTGFEPYADARATWLEFDSSASSSDPNLLFGFWPDKPDTLRSAEWLVETALPLLLGSDVSSVLKQNLRRALESKPHSTNDFQIGLMISRKLQAVRLCVFDLPYATVSDYLQQLDWQGPLEQVQEYVSAFAPHADLVGLHIDIGAVVYPHIGIEPGFDASCWSRQPHLEPRWERIFEVLETRGLLSAAKRQALLDWTGYQKIQIDERDMLLLRGISHIKVVLGSNMATKAKGYFGLAHRAPEQPQ